MVNPDFAENLPFHHYGLKHRLTAWISIHLFDNVTYTVHRGLLRGMKRKGGLGWVPESIWPEVKTAEGAFWRRLNLRDLIVYDIGAFHGLLTLFFSLQAKEVICFEPNTQNHKRLMENLNLNAVRNVKVYKVGVGSRSEKLRMVASPLMPGGASVNSSIVDRLLRSGIGTVIEEIPIVALDDEIPKAGLPPPDFIKIDIEGAEIEALKGARNTLEVYQPTLFLEIHGETVSEKRRKVAEIVALLWDLNFRNIRHVESDSMITPENSSVAMEGHLHCWKS
jgi:FkbM family methyltransferase